MTTQPKDSPRWSTDANFPAGSDPWSATPTRVAPSSGEKAAGYVPATQVPAQTLNWLHGTAGDHIDVLADMLALSFARPVRVPSTDIVTGGTNGGAVDPKCGSCVHSTTLQPWFVTRHISGKIARTQDFVDWFVGGFPSSVTSFTDFYADATLSAANNDVVALADDGAWKVYASTNAGNTWGTDVALGGSGTPTCVARYKPGGLVIVAGLDTIRTSPADLSGFTARTVPVAYAGQFTTSIVVPRGGETAAGVLLLSSGLHAPYSADGTTWTDTVLPSGVGAVGGCWSESHQAWFVLTAGLSGDLYLLRAATPTSGWTLVATLETSAAGKGVASFGRYLVVYGEGLGHSTIEWTGGALVTADFSTFRPLATSYGTDQVEQNACYFDGRLHLSHRFQDPTDYGISISASARVPWAL